MVLIETVWIAMTFRLVKIKCALSVHAKRMKFLVQSGVIQYLEQPASDLHTLLSHLWLRVKSHIVLSPLFFFQTNWAQCV